MARARNIKPGFFINEDLVELPFSTRLLFIGLWTIADREGRLDDRPRKIKMAVYPADDVDIEQGLQELHDARLIIRYQADGKGFIEIINFIKHQSPHVKEPESTIPAPGKSGASLVLAALNDERGMMKDEGRQPAPPRTTEQEILVSRTESILKTDLSLEARMLLADAIPPGLMSDWLEFAKMRLLTLDAKKGRTPANVHNRLGYWLTDFTAQHKKEYERVKNGKLTKLPTAAEKLAADAEYMQTAERPKPADFMRGV